MSSATRLVVQSDDFGMCHAVNDGVVRAFQDGILTQASMMVACPWFPEAARLTREHGIPVGTHLMLTAEWDFYRWGPLTGGRSLVKASGRFPKTIPEAKKRATVEEAIDEFVAQIETLRAEGIEPAYLDCHMGIVRLEAYVEMCRRYEKRFMHPIGEVAYPWESRWELSSFATDEKEDAFIAHLESLGPGDHFVYAHCAVDSSELWALTSPDADNFDIAAELRIADLAAITSPRVRKVVEAREIQLVSMRDLV
jgi:hypothetical protein